MDSLDYFPELELSSQLSSRVLAQRSPNVVFSAAGFRAAALARSTAGPLMLTTRSSNDVRAYSSHAPPGGPESPVVKFLIGGLVTVIFEMSGGHFLEFLKISKQTSTDSYWGIIKRVTASKGIAGTLDGFIPWGMAQAVAKGAVFSWGQAACAKALHGTTGLSKETKTVITGGVGGFVQGIVMSPLLLLKTRVMTDPVFRTSGGLMATAVASAKVGARVVTTEGPSALMKGVSVFAFKRAADWSTRYLFVVMVEEVMRKSPSDKLSDGQQAIASLAGGSISALVTIPIDVLVATFQSAGKAGKKVSIIETFKEQGGIGNIVAFSTRGLVARVAHVALTTMMMKTVTSMIYNMLPK